ncbi:MAG: hypothetical protein FJ297_04690 [Planctomycetes bacterium]|nr:hypothetical protein [Planctomycetota bacterium]
MTIRPRPACLASAAKRTTVVLGVAALYCLAGCTSKSPPDSGPSPSKAASDPHGHDHDGHAHHDHAHGHEGPHGGHWLDLMSGDRLVHAEWTHDDKTGLIAVYLSDASNNEPVSDPPPTIEIEIRTGKEPRKYTLPLTATIREAPARAAYSIEDPALVTALAIIVEGSEPLLRATLEGKAFEAKFESHDHAHAH